MAGGIYHSGDLAYRDEAGYAYFAGRLGDWMRVDGENLGTAPIERILLRHPAVAEAAVYAVPDEKVGDQVAAALVLRSDLTPVALVGEEPLQVDRGAAIAERLPVGVGGFAQIVSGQHGADSSG